MPQEAGGGRAAGPTAAAAAGGAAAAAAAAVAAAAGAERGPAAGAGQHQGGHGEEPQAQVPRLQPSADAPAEDGRGGRGVLLLLWLRQVQLHLPAGHRAGHGRAGRRGQVPAAQHGGRQEEQVAVSFIKLKFH